MANKGFITDWLGQQILPITRGELVLDVDGNIALNSVHFLAEDGHPGLITAAERAMLTGSGGTGGISDIYDKLQYINNGLKFNGNSLNFYNSEGTSTPINIISTGDNKLNIVVTGNEVNFGLQAITQDTTSVAQILKSITVDKYGRVTAVTGAALTNAEIPTELTGKTLKNSVLNGCTTENEEIGDNVKAVVNKAYVDKAIQNITGIATGALKFGGPLSTADEAVTVVTETQYQNHYYKVTKSFTIEAQYLYSETEVIANKLVKIGDTLIVYPVSATESKFIHVPSGDDITTITIREEGSAENALTSEMGNITFQFSSIFDVTNLGGTTVSIAFPQAGTNSDGYLSKSDYNLFKSYYDNLSVSYESITPSAGDGIYQIGKLTIGGAENIIYGKNNISSLTITDGTTNAYNPILKFTETGTTDVKITYKGLNGIQIRKNGNDIEFLAANTVIEQDVPNVTTERSTKYLTVADGYKFGVKLGSVDKSTGAVTDGLTDYNEFNELRKVVTYTTTFELISYSLKGAASEDEYRYGNDKLKAAVYIETI